MDGEAPYRSGAFQYYAIHTMTITWGEITKSLARVFLHIFNAALPHLHNRVVPNIRPKNQRIRYSGLGTYKENKNLKKFLWVNYVYVLSNICAEKNSLIRF